MRIMTIIITLVASAVLAAAESVVATVEAEAMVRGGPYAGAVISPFAGVALYANGDHVRTTTALPAIPGRYRVDVRGASNSSGTAAGVAVLMGGSKRGALAFGGTSASDQSLEFDVSTGATAQELQLLLDNDDGRFDTLIDCVRLVHVGSPPPLPPAPQTPSTGAFASGNYRNLFREMGLGEAEVQARLDAYWSQLFYGGDADQRLYYPVGTDAAYILDTGNGDVRSEGMSYGMMICVQMNRRAEFDRLWTWAKRHMRHASGPRRGYFAWQCRTDGSVIDANSASDGEIWIATSLFFAAGRWGDDTYRRDAQAILDAMLHQTDDGVVDSITNMFDARTRQVVFVPYANAATFTDPSYHVPAFLELWSRWAERDRQFWREAVTAARTLLYDAAHPTTGLMPDYSEFTGAPRHEGGHGDFRFDAWRAMANVAVDHAWFGADARQTTLADRLQAFFHAQGMGTYANQYRLDGTPLSTDRSPGLVAMNAVVSLAATHPRAWAFVDALWRQPIPSGRWRYYDGLLSFLGMLHTSGRFRIYAPQGLEGQPTPPPTPAPPTTPLPPTNGSGSGLTATYFDSRDFTTRKLLRTDAVVDFAWGSGSPDSAIGADTFSVRWSGSVEAQHTQTYTFHVIADDGVRLWVGGRQLIDRWIDQAPTEASGSIALTAGQRYPIVLEYYENRGGATARLLWSGPSTAKQIIPTTQLHPAQGDDAVPAPWRTEDIGAVAVAGSASVAGGTWTVTGSGADIWSTADEFRYVWQPFTGDGEIVARVATMAPATDPWAKAGVMIRDSGAAGSAHAMMCATPGNGLAFQHRLTAGGASDHAAGARLTAPAWVKLVRVGTRIEGWQSADGADWTLVGVTSLTLSTSARIGLCVTSHRDGTRISTTFDHVSVVRAPNAGG